MYSPQGYTNGPVPVLPTMNNPAPYSGNRFPSTYPPGFVNNCSFPPPFGANTGVNSSSPTNCNINALMSVPPPGFSSSSANLLPSQGAQGSFAPNNFVNPPPFGLPPFPGCPVPFPNSTAVQQYAAYPSYQAANFAYPPPGASFTIPPPPIPRPLPRNANYSKFPASNSRQHTNYATQTKQSMPFHCESCDRDFPTEAKQKQHISEHVICGIEGCSFSAHMKIVEKHISLQHRTGLFNRIVKGNSPEEIAKWVADRKRQFPTRERIEQKHAQKEEMDKRGERYSEPRKKFNNRFSNDNRKHNGSNKFDNLRRFPLNKRMQKSNVSETKSQDQSPANTESRSRRRREILVKNDEDDDDQYIRNLAPFRGTAYYVNADDDETDSIRKNNSTICSDSDAHKTPIFDVFDSDTESNDVTNGATSPVHSEISLNEVTNNSSSPIHSDVDNYEFNARCPSPAQLKDETSVLESSPLNNEEVTSNSIDFLGINQVYETAENDFSNTREDFEDEKEAGTDVSCVNSSQNCSVAASTSMPTMSTSLDLLKAYDFSDDDEKESNEIVETTQTPPEIAAPSYTQLSDDSEPEECCSKICPPPESVVSDEKIVSNEPVSCVEEADSKKSRKRKRHKDTENSEESKNEKKAKEADKEKPKVPDLMNHQKRNRRPTLLEKLLANEIKHERNVILQCVRHVVQNNYFDIGQSK